MFSKEKIIELLGLKPLETEGGFYRESHRSRETSLIYYMITKNSWSSLHRLPKDEIYCFHSGGKARMLLLHENSESEEVIFGNENEKQFVVPRNSWQGMILEEGEYALFSVIVSPAFEINDYEKGDAKKLAEEYPEKKELIGRLSRRRADKN